jgi:hypothetical protein
MIADYAAGRSYLDSALALLHTAAYKLLVWDALDNADRVLFQTTPVRLPNRGHETAVSTS